MSKKLGMSKNDYSLANSGILLYSMAHLSLAFQATVPFRPQLALLQFCPFCYFESI